MGSPAPGLSRVGSGPLATNEALLVSGYVPGGKDALEIRAPLPLYDTVEWHPGYCLDPGNTRYFLVRGPWQPGSRLAIVIAHPGGELPLTLEIGPEPLPPPEVALTFGAPTHDTVDIPIFGRRELVNLPFRGRVRAGGPMARLKLMLGQPGTDNRMGATDLIQPGEHVEGSILLSEPAYELVLGGTLTDLAGQTATFQQNAC